VAGVAIHGTDLDEIAAVQMRAFARDPFGSRLVLDLDDQDSANHVLRPCRRAVPCNRPAALRHHMLAAIVGQLEICDVEAATFQMLYPVDI
jgi:hypothetical protein